ncbi:MAG: hypothetical protein JRI56_00080 [Deltaproteobacteria bacterium]|nr:hypothetical protein [Deltaproteobacteria bacterium]
MEIRDERESNEIAIKELKPGEVFCHRNSIFVVVGQNPEYVSMTSTLCRETVYVLNARTGSIGVFLPHEMVEPVSATLTILD